MGAPPACGAKPIGFGGGNGFRRSRSVLNSQFVILCAYYIYYIVNMLLMKIISQVDQN